MEIKNLPDKEFKVMVIKMLTRAGRTQNFQQKKTQGRIRAEEYSN